MHRPDVTITVFPRDDEALRVHVGTLLESGISDADGLEQGLRGTFPAAVVRTQAALAGFGNAHWYVYRDGSVRPPADEAWLESPDVGHLIIDGDGCYVSADEHAARIYGVPRASIAGARIGTFTRHEGGDAGGLRAFERLRAVGSLASTAIVVRPDGEEWLIDYRIETAGDRFLMAIRRRAPD